MSTINIKDAQGNILARHILSEAWNEKGLAFYSEDSEFIQVGTWHYDKGKELLAHAHKPVKRTVSSTQETLYIRSGSVQARIYDKDHKLVCTRTAREGDVLILLFGGHGYDILENGTQVLEVKNGPYPGAEKDRIRF